MTAGHPAGAGRLVFGGCFGFAGAANDDLIGLDGDGYIALVGPMFRVKLNILDRRVKPETVTVVTMIEGAFDPVPRSPSTASPAAAAATAGSAFGLGAIGFWVFCIGFAIVRGFTASFTLGRGCCRFLFSLGTGSFFCCGGRFDLGFDLVAKIDIEGAFAFIVRREVVLTAELTEFRSTHFELVGDPGVGAALADPGPDLIELGA